MKKKEQNGNEAKYRKKQFENTMFFSQNFNEKCETFFDKFQLNKIVTRNN